MGQLLGILAGLALVFQVDPVKVDEAIRKGAEYLKAKNSAHLERFEHVPPRQMEHAELVLLTYLHAEVPETDPAFQELFQNMMDRPLETTYCVSLQAMVLEELDRVKYQGRIADCAQFLVDNQGSDGSWSYGETMQVEKRPLPPPPPKDVATAQHASPPPSVGPRKKPRVRTFIRISKKRDGISPGDHSNSQYAALGLRACYDSGIVIPEQVVKKAIESFRASQKDDRTIKPEPLELEGEGNGGAAPSKSRRTAAGTTIMAAPQGWCYGPHPEHQAYGSMTAGIVGTVAIWLYIADNDGGRRQSWKRDVDVVEGLQWINKNFSVTYNPGPCEATGFTENSPDAYYYYYMYALERTGMLYGTEKIGTHHWYPEGAQVLLDHQESDGHWGWYGGGTVDTCFAILFLKRATRPLLMDVATGGRHE